MKSGKACHKIGKHSHKSGKACRFSPKASGKTNFGLTKTDCEGATSQKPTVFSHEDLAKH